MDNPNENDRRVDGAGDASAKEKPIFFSHPTLEKREDRIDIDLKRHHPVVAPPLEMRELLLDFYAVERVINVLFAGSKYKPQRDRFRDELLMTARIGFCGSDYDIDSGRFDIILTQDEIADEFPTLRDALWKTYLTILILFAAFFIFGCILYYYLIINPVFAAHNKDLLQFVPAFPQICIALLWIPFGVSIGIFLEFVFRMGENISYDRLLLINPGRWKPWRRTASTLITAYVFAFIIGVDAFKIGIGNILLNDFVSGRPWLSVAVGFVTGFTFPYVRDIVTQFKPERRASPGGKANVTTPPRAGGAEKSKAN